MKFFKNHNNTGIGKWVFSALLMMFFLLIGSHGYSQIDSRNQIRPDREPNITNPDKKTKRIKTKRSQQSGSKKRYSNKKQLKRSKRARAKKVDSSPKGDLTGRKVETKHTPRKTKAYPQPDPYKGRRIRTERSRAGPDAPAVRSATKRGERARTGDISGQKRVRQKSVKTRRTPSYAQPNPYIGRKVRTEKSRAKSNTREINSVRSVSRPSESRKRANQPRAISATGSPKVKTKSQKNVYKNHERRGGERSTDKDIAGKKIRTKNTQSAVRITGGIEFSNPRPYRGRKRRGDGERFKRSAARLASARSVTRKPETSRYKDNDIYSSRKNSRSRPPVKVKKAKSVRSLSQPSKKGERVIFGGKYSAGPTRSVSGYSQARSRRSAGPPISLSGNRKRYKQKNTYKGKDRHFGENSTTKDIAGRRLRTRNYRSVKPNGTASGFRPYYGSTAPLSGKAKGGGSGTRSTNRAGWNNGGAPVQGRGRNANSEAMSGFRGKMPLSGMPSYGKGKEGSYGGNINAKSIRKYSGSKEGSYRGRIPAKSLRRYGAGKEGSYAGGMISRRSPKGGGSVTKGWNNGGQPLTSRGQNANSIASSGYKGKMPLSSIPDYGKRKEGSYPGRIPAKSLRKYGAGKEGSYAGGMISRRAPKGGGSITKGWNNGGQPLTSRGQNANSIASSGYKGKMPLSSIPNYGKRKEGSYRGRIPAKSLRKYRAGKEGSYAGRIKSQKPLQGGGSITRHWNNGGQPLIGRGQNANSDALSNYRGKMPLSSMPSYGDSKEGIYSGKMKARKPLKGGGGSITRHWNNKGAPLAGKGRNANGEAMSNYRGKMPLNSMPSYGDSKEGVYAGKIKAQKPLKGGGGSITRHWNNKGEPLDGMGRSADGEAMSSYQGKMKAPDKITQSPGTERGRTRSFTFLRIGNPTQGGLHREITSKSRNNNLPDDIKGTNKLRTSASPGTERGRTKSLSFLTLGNPTKGGLHRELASKSRNSSLPKALRGTDRLRISASPGTERGRTRSLSFITIGNPTKGGFYKSPAQAKGRLHPSSSYTASSKSRNSVKDKEQPVKLKIWWAKLFNKNGNQPDSVKETPKRPRYDKGERSIWETAERPEWYNNK